MAGSGSTRLLYDLPAAVMCKFYEIMDALDRAEWERFGKWWWRGERGARWPVRVGESGRASAYGNARQNMGLAPSTPSALFLSTGKFPGSAYIAPRCPYLSLNLGLCPLCWAMEVLGSSGWIIYLNTPKSSAPIHWIHLDRFPPLSNVAFLARIYLFLNTFSLFYWLKTFLCHWNQKERLSVAALEGDLFLSLTNSQLVAFLVSSLQ